MEKALNMGKVSVTGSFHLFIGKVASTVILAIGSIILAWLLVPAEYGLYTIALVPSLTMTLFHDWGIKQAMTKYIAQYNATGNEESIRDIITAGLIFKITTGLGLSLLSLVLASFIATTFLNRPQISPLIAVASIAIISEALVTATQSNFNGFEKMNLTSFTMIVQSLVKTAMSPLLVIVGFGAIGAVFGYTLASLTAGIIGLLLLYFRLFKKLKKSKNHKTNIIRNLKMLLRYGVPLSLSSIMSGFLVQIYAFLMAFYCSDVMIGNYQIAANFALFLAFFTFPIATVLFPAFSKLDPKREPQLLRTVYMSAVKYAALFLVPATMASIVLSEPMVSTLFGQKWVYAPLFLAVTVIQNLFVLFGSIIMQSFLAAAGETKILLKLNILNLLLSIPLAVMLISTYGIIGLIVGNLLAGIPHLIVGLYWIWKHYDVRPSFQTSSKIFLAAIIAAITCYFSLDLFVTAYWIKLAIGGSIFLISYLIAAPIIGAINKKDVQILRSLFSSLGVISKLINVPLVLAEKVASLKTA